MEERNTDPLLRSSYEIELTYPSNPRLDADEASATTIVPFPNLSHQSIFIDTLQLQEEADDWNFPSDHRGDLCKRTLGVVESSAIILILVYSLVVLIHEDLYHTQRELFYYVVAVLLSDFVVLSIAGLILCVTCCTGGSHAVGSAIGLFIQMSRAAAGYVFLGYGIYFLYKYQQDFYEHHSLLLGYFTAVIIFLLAYSFASFPAAAGTVGFLGTKIWKRISPHPLVEFHQPSRPTWFTYSFGLDRLKDHLSNSTRPTLGRRDYIPITRRAESFDFERGEEIGTLTAAPLEELLPKMGLDKKAEELNNQ